MPEWPRAGLKGMDGGHFWWYHDVDIYIPAPSYAGGSVVIGGSLAGSICRCPRS